MHPMRRNCGGPDSVGMAGSVSLSLRVGIEDPIDKRYVHIYAI